MHGAFSPDCHPLEEDGGMACGSCSRKYLNGFERGPFPLNGYIPREWKVTERFLLFTPSHLGPKKGIRCVPGSASDALSRRAINTLFFMLSLELCRFASDILSSRSCTGLATAYKFNTGYSVYCILFKRKI